MQELKEFIEQNMPSFRKTLKELCLIPAPSHHEEKRAEFCKEWFSKNGMQGAYIDEAKNVIYPYHAEGRDDLTVLVAHTDTVFPDTEPMPYVDDGERICCPGVGDDTASLAVMMLVARYFTENNVDAGGVLFVCNSCEEGLGNLKGTRRIFSDFEGRIRQFYSFDSGSLTSMTDRCVGSHRYELTVKTAGGHSWGGFGKKNAIAELCGIINGIYSIVLPKKEGKRVSYNVGIIEGGTSVNTIAQKASALVEYRSDDEEMLAYMKSEFERIFESARNDDVSVEVELIGNRPCAGKVDLDKIELMKKTAATIAEEVTGKTVSFKSGSTDCNIPLSLGIPALCFGVYNGLGCHTREEYVVKASLLPGLEIGIKAMIELCKL